LQNTLARRGRVVESFRIEGLVRAVVRERKLAALQDASGAVLLELPAINSSVCVGEWLAVEGDNCALTRSGFGIQVGTAPVVNNDGDHPPYLKSGSVFLRAGVQPIRLLWFNGEGMSALMLEYEGPGIQRQSVPEGLLWHSPGTTNRTALERGLKFAAYVGQGWDALPDFSQLEPAAEGVAANIARTYSVREKNAALAFDGYLETAEAGSYTFYLTSDDGGRLFVGDPATACRTVVLEKTSVLPVGSLEKALAGPTGQQWITWEGVVNFVGPEQRGLELELTGSGNRVSVRIVDGAELAAANLLHRTLRVKGICEVNHDLEPRGIIRLIVPSSGQIVFCENSSEAASAPDSVLTTAEQIRRLKANEARGRRAKIRGVVTWASPAALVLHDATGGVYVHLFSREWADQPTVGSLWEIEGPTDPGDFSPVIRAERGIYLGTAAMPEPIRPTWDQLMNGSLDAELRRSPRRAYRPFSHGNDVADTGRKNQGPA